jgi:hypothetical protein
VFRKAVWAKDSSGPGEGATREVTGFGFWAHEQITAYDAPRSYSYLAARSLTFRAILAGCAKALESQRKRRGHLVFGDVVVVESAFGGDGFGSVFGAGSLAARHHRPALVVCCVDGRRFAVPQFAGGCAQRREVGGAAGSGEVGVPGRRRPEDGAIGQLSVIPAALSAPERLQQVVLPTARRTLR